MPTTSYIPNTSTNMVFDGQYSALNTAQIASNLDSVLSSNGSGSLSWLGKNATSGIPVLSGGALITTQLPTAYSYDVLQYATLGSFPVTGNAFKLYYNQQFKDFYTWNGSSYDIIPYMRSTGVSSMSGAINMNSNNITNVNNLTSNECTITTIHSTAIDAPSIGCTNIDVSGRVDASQIGSGGNRIDNIFASSISASGGVIAFDSLSVNGSSSNQIASTSATLNVAPSAVNMNVATTNAIEITTSGVRIVGGTQEVEINSEHFNISYCPSDTGTNLVVNGSGDVRLATSSRRYKKNIQNLALDTSKIFDLQPVSFLYISKNYDGSLKCNEENCNCCSKSLGYIAEDANVIIPDIVNKNNEGLPNSISYELLSVYLIAELKKLKVAFDSYVALHP